MNVLFFSPGFPAEMPLFVRGLADVGAKVWGIGDGPVEMIPEDARKALAGYLRVQKLWDSKSVIEAVRGWREPGQIDRVECLWEPGMILAAELREALGVPGMTVAQTIPFRDKGKMKEVLDAAGLRTPRHRRCDTERGCWAAAEEIGFPLIIKPIAGAGSADTYRIDDPRQLAETLPKLRHVEEVSVEEFIEGEEYTFDTICSNGTVHYFNVAWYRPKPLIGRTVEWISPQTVTLRDVDAPAIQPGITLGLDVLKALGFETGYTHMEWFLTPKGEAVFGEIAGRPPGARSVALMQWANDLDVFRGWAEAACFGRFSQPVERKYNSAVTFKRAKGQGRIRAIRGLEGLLARFGDAVVEVDLLPIGAPRRNWKQTLVSDGYLIVRHPDLAKTLEMADAVGTDLELIAE
jgi:hypothetical protein